MSNSILHGLPWQAKARAAGIHVAISGAIFFVLLYLILYQWYPEPFFATDGGWQGIRLAFFVDIVIGPVLTFVVFNPAKPVREIMQDLAFVALVQAAALGWGIWAIYSQRPVAVVEWQGVFYSQTADVYALQGVDLAQVEALSAAHPPLVHARSAATSKEYSEWVLMALNHDLPESGFFPFYQPIDRNLAATFERKLDIDSLASGDADLAERLKRLEAALGRDRDRLIFMPFQGRYSNAILVFSTQGGLLGSLPSPQSTDPKE